MIPDLAVWAVEVTDKEEEEEMRTMTFTVQFAEDIGTLEANKEIGENLASDLEAILFGYFEGDGDGMLLEIGRAFGISVEDAPGERRDVRATGVDYTGGS